MPLSSYVFLIDRMPAVTVSPKFQVVIPRAVRERLGLEPGQRMEVIVLGDRIELIPLRPMTHLRGLLSGIDTDVTREADRAL